MAIGAYAEYLVGMIDRSTLDAEVAKVPAEQMAEYEEITAGLRASMER